MDKRLKKTKTKLWYIHAMGYKSAAKRINYLITLYNFHEPLGNYAEVLKIKLVMIHTYLFPLM